MTLQEDLHALFLFIRAPVLLDLDTLHPFLDLGCLAFFSVLHHPRYVVDLILAPLDLIFDKLALLNVLLTITLFRIASLYLLVFLEKLLLLGHRLQYLARLLSFLLL